MKINLNLLPEERKRAIHRNKIFYLSLQQELLFLLPLLALLAILLSINFMLKLQKNSIVNQNFQAQTTGQYQELGSYEDKFKTTNEFSANLLKIKKEHLYWAQELIEISSLLPEGVHISNLASSNYKISLVGSANTRDELLAFKDNLEKNACVSEVNVPLSNMVERENVSFQLDFLLKEDCLKKNK